MTDAFVIELDSISAGIAVRERGGFRFYVSDTRFHPIDERKFRHLRDIRNAVERLAHPRLALAAASH